LSLVRDLRKHDGVLGMFLNESDKALQRPIPFVVNEFTTTRGLELESGEASYPKRNRRREVIFRRFQFGTTLCVTELVKRETRGKTYISKVSFKGAYFWASDSQMGARRLQWPHLLEEIGLSPLNDDRQ